MLYIKTHVFFLLNFIEGYDFLIGTGQICRFFGFHLLLKYNNELVSDLKKAGSFSSISSAVLSCLPISLSACSQLLPPLVVR